MNWAVETREPLTAADFPDAVDELTVTGATPEVEQQLEAAKAAAKAMLESGGVGDVSDDEAYFGAELNGTANPAHEPVDGEPNDRFAVAVRQITFELTPEPEQEPAAEEVAEAVA